MVKELFTSKNTTCIQEKIHYLCIWIYNTYTYKSQQNVSSFTVYQLRRSNEWFLHSLQHAESA